MVHVSSLSAPTVAYLSLVLAACGDPLGATGDTREATPPMQLAVLEPREGAILSGLPVFRVLLAGSAGAVTWELDRQAARAMSPEADGRTWAAEVDPSTWRWNGTGVYGVTFRAWDSRGRALGEGHVQVRVTKEATRKEEGGASPFLGASLWVDPASNARKQADAWRRSRPDDALLMDRIAAHSQADWFGDWTTDVRGAVRRRAATIAADGALPVFVAYNVPLRDCGSHSAGGAPGPDAYRRWIRDFAAGLEGIRTVVVLEPDALAQLDCLPRAERQLRVELLRDAAAVLTQAGATVYVDAGNARWHSPAVVAERLRAVGTSHARGFALNVSNFWTTDETAAYGRVVSDLLGGTPFIVDTSRNGLGSNGEWCNPSGRALGSPPSGAPGIAGVDALLWIKHPGQSDGTCNGGPRAGTWWPEYALELARLAPIHAVVAATPGS